MSRATLAMFICRKYMVPNSFRKYFFAGKDTWRESSWDFPGGTVVKNLPANAGDMGSIPGPGRFPDATEQLSLCATTTEPAL